MTRSAAPWVRGFAISLLAVAPYARAHHSFAMFDDKHETVVTGTVMEFQWGNPHTYIQLISDADKVNWTIELNGANGLVRDKWRPSSLTAGERITVHIRPLRNGAPGGNLMWVEKADGTILGRKPVDANH